MVSAESYNPHPLPDSVRLGPEHHNTAGQLTSIGFYGGEIGITIPDPQDLRPTVIGLVAADLSQPQVSSYMRQQYPHMPSIGLQVHNVYTHLSLNAPNRAFGVVAHAWRQKVLQVKKPVTLPTDHAPELVAVPTALRRIIGGMFMAHSMLDVEQDPELAHLHVRDLLEDFKDMLGVKTDAAALSFGLLALKNSPAPPPKPTVAGPSIVTEPQKPAPANVPESYQASGGRIVLGADGFSAIFDISDRLGCPRSSDIIVDVLAGHTKQATMEKYHLSEDTFKFRVSEAYADLDPRATSKEGETDRQVLATLVQAGNVQFSLPAGRPDIHLTDTQFEILKLLSIGHNQAEITRTTSHGYAAVRETLAELHTIFKMPNTNLICLAAYAYRILPRPSQDVDAIPSPEAPVVIPAHYEPATVANGFVYWAGGVLRTALPERHPFSAASTAILMRYYCGASPAELGTDIAERKPSYISTRYKLPARSEFAIRQLFDSGWLHVLKSVDLPNKLYPVEEAIIRALPTTRRPQIAQELGISERSYNANIQYIGSVLGVTSTRSIAMLGYLSRLLGKESADG